MSNDIDEKVESFMSNVQSKVDEIFPVKQVRISIKNKPWFDHKLRILSKKKKDIFKREGRSSNYKDAVSEFKTARNAAIRKYVDKTVDTVTRKNSPNLHKVLKKLGTAPGEAQKPSFKLEEHEGKNDQQIADDLADYFSKISSEYALSLIHI